MELAVEDAPIFENVRISTNPSKGNYTIHFGKELSNLKVTALIVLDNLCLPIIIILPMVFKSLSLVLPESISLN